MFTGESKRPIAKVNVYSVNNEDFKLYNAKVIIESQVQNEEIEKIEVEIKWA